MNERPDTKYAWNGDVALAYQVFGDGPVDLVYMQGCSSHVDLNWESPFLARFLRGLGQLARVMHIDRRGFGCSDRFSPGDVAPLEVQVDDLVAVMDAAGSERAVIFGSFDTGLAATLFAATNPERTAGLILCDPFATYCVSEETPWQYSETRWGGAQRPGSGELGTPGWNRGMEGFTDEREFLGSSTTSSALIDWKNRAISSSSSCGFVSKMAKKPGLGVRRTSSPASGSRDSARGSRLPCLEQDAEPGDGEHKGRRLHAADDSTRTSIAYTMSSNASAPSGMHRDGSLRDRLDVHRCHGRASLPTRSIQSWASSIDHTVP